MLGNGLLENLFLGRYDAKGFSYIFVCRCAHMQRKSLLTQVSLEAWFCSKEKLQSLFSGLENLEAANLKL